MTPQEKAQQLINAYINLSNGWVYGKENWEHKKQCALICCNEVLGYMGADRGYEFWTKVKQEIEKL